jgi:hypothetical protein
MRLLDIVTVKGSNVPMRFFTINLYPEHLKEESWNQLDLDGKERKNARKEF